MGHGTDEGAGHLSIFTSGSSLAEYPALAHPEYGRIGQAFALGPRAYSAAVPSWDDSSTVLPLQASRLTTLINGALRACSQGAGNLAAAGSAPVEGVLHGIAVAESRIHDTSMLAKHLAGEDIFTAAVGEKE